MKTLEKQQIPYMFGCLSKQESLVLKRKIIYSHINVIDDQWITLFLLLRLVIVTLCNSRLILIQIVSQLNF